VGKESEFPSDLFMELASDTRLAILKMLDEKPTRSTQLSEKLSLTIQETHRNTSRLSETGIIKKDPEGFFSLTNYGKIVVSQIPYFEFIKKFHSFFDDHFTGNIPSKFLQRIGALQNSELVVKVTNVHEKLKKMEVEAKQYIKLILSQAWSEEGKILLDRLKNGVKTYSIFDEHSTMPDEIHSTITPKFEKFQEKGLAEVRKYNGKIGISVIITEKNSAVMFPHIKDEIDFNTVFVSEDPDFHEWCTDLFEYFWSNSRPAKISNNLARKTN
jgi:predicted transcriptional regulator